MFKRQFNRKQPKNIRRLTWDCNTQSGQCGAVILISEDEAEYLVQNNFCYENEITDPDNKYNFVGDLHPLWEGKGSSGAKVVAALEKYRAAQSFPKNLGPNA